MDFPRGSEWRIWDLHCHTPASFDWKGPALPIDSPKFAQSFIEAVTATNVAVFAGYEAIEAFTVKNPETLKGVVVLPGVELRVEAPVDYKLNIHVLFPEHTQQQAQYVPWQA
jgi:predicted metal-dependent phosphoesterase TrpH